MQRIPFARMHRRSVTHPLIIALLILAHTPGFAAAQIAAPDKDAPSRTASGLETDFNSRYVFRGLTYSRGPVKQSTAWVTFSEITFYAWVNIMLDHEPQRRRFSEIDLGVSYAREWKKLTLEPAVDYYRYRFPPLMKYPPTGEASVKLSYSIGHARIFTKQIVDIGSYRGAYFGEAGLSHEQKLSRKTTFSAGVILGWASSKFNEAYVRVPKPAFNLIGGEVSFTYTPNSRFYLKPHFELTRVPDSRLRSHLNSPTIGKFGVAIGFNLSGASSP